MQCSSTMSRSRMCFTLGQNPSIYSSHCNNKKTDFRQLYSTLFSCCSWLILALFCISTITPTQAHISSSSSTHSHSDAQCNHVHPKLNDVSTPQTIKLTIALYCTRVSFVLLFTIEKSRSNANNKLGKYSG